MFLLFFIISLLLAQGVEASNKTTIYDLPNELLTDIIGQTGLPDRNGKTFNPEETVKKFSSTSKESYKRVYGEKDLLQGSVLSGVIIEVAARETEKDFYNGCFKPAVPETVQKMLSDKNKKSVEESYMNIYENIFKGLLKNEKILKITLSMWVSQEGSFSKNDKQIFAPDKSEDNEAFLFAQKFYNSVVHIEKTDSEKNKNYSETSVSFFRKDKDKQYTVRVYRDGTEIDSFLNDLSEMEKSKAYPMGIVISGTLMGQLFETVIEFLKNSQNNEQMRNVIQVMQNVPIVSSKSTQTLYNFVHGNNKDALWLLLEAKILGVESLAMRMDPIDRRQFNDKITGGTRCILNSVPIQEYFEFEDCKKLIEKLPQLLFNNIFIGVIIYCAETGNFYPAQITETINLLGQRVRKYPKERRFIVQTIKDTLLRPLFPEKNAAVYWKIIWEAGLIDQDDLKISDFPSQEKYDDLLKLFAEFNATKEGVKEKNKVVNREPKNDDRGNLEQTTNMTILNPVKPFEAKLVEKNNDPIDTEEPKVANRKKGNLTVSDLETIAQRGKLAQQDRENLKETVETYTKNKEQIRMQKNRGIFSKRNLQRVALVAGGLGILWILNKFVLSKVWLKKTTVPA